ncbi:hypothetical protein Zmor_023173 [Zophobas morio]|uniref:HIT-type domain-containing protein n=1 Tax=Zophobas morio TaxID=2755281 RepID=A0AA38HXD6_9CUCU|nr:hypothetical protein Zmor_023173 [Zophobas morio]
MEKSCIICEGDGKYKCPTCLVFYCSVQCCKKHRENGCDVWVKNDEKTLQQPLNNQSKPRYTTADTVPLEKLMLLKDDENLKCILSNPHLRDLLVTINNSKEPEKTMQMAMQEPLFVEFADACLRVVEPPRND